MLLMLLLLLLLLWARSELTDGCREAGNLRPQLCLYQVGLQLRLFLLPSLTIRTWLTHMAPTWKAAASAPSLARHEVVLEPV